MWWAQWVVWDCPGPRDRGTLRRVADGGFNVVPYVGAMTAMARFLSLRLSYPGRRVVMEVLDDADVQRHVWMNTVVCPSYPASP